MGRERPKGMKDGKEMRRRSEELLKEMGVNIDPDTWWPSTAQQQIIEIAKVFSTTAHHHHGRAHQFLTKTEIDILFRLIHRLKA